MQTPSVTRGVIDRATPYVMTAIFAAFVYKASFLIWEWAMPVVLTIRDWTYDALTSLGISTNAAEYCAAYTPYSVLVTLYFFCGTIIGLATRARWRRFTIIFAFMLVATPYVKSPREIRANARMYGWDVLITDSVLNLSLAISASILGAWLASGPGKRRRENRRAANLCEACGYSLAGNTSGICPECGLKTDPIPAPIANPSVTTPP